jgi:antitoxin component YwqK of YwqJK toxin-antitoxin module
MLKGFIMASHLGFSETVSPNDLVIRNGIFYKKFTDVPFIGDVSGQQNGAIINGKRDGFWESYYENGQLNWKGNYKDDCLDGPWEYYYDNGQLSYKGNYIGGKEDGIFEHYKENGKFQKKEKWKNGKVIFK